VYTVENELMEGGLIDEDQGDLLSQHHLPSLDRFSLHVKHLPFLK